MTEAEGTVVAATEAALITANDMTSIELAIPRFEDGDEVPELVVLMSAFLARISDQEFVREMLEWFDRLSDERLH